MKKLMPLTLLAMCSAVAFAAEPVAPADAAQYGDAAPVVEKLRAGKNTPFESLAAEFKTGVVAEKNDVDTSYKGFIFGEKDKDGRAMYLYGTAFKFKMPPTAVVIDEPEKAPFRLVVAFHNKMENDALFTDTPKLKKYFEKHALEMTPVAKYRDSLYTSTLDGSEEILVRKMAADPSKLIIKYMKNDKVKGYGFTFVKGVL